jgi:hypothetical protein
MLECPLDVTPIIMLQTRTVNLKHLRWRALHCQPGTRHDGKNTPAGGATAVQCERAGAALATRYAAECIDKPPTRPQKMGERAPDWAIGRLHVSMWLGFGFSRWRPAFFNECTNALHYMRTYAEHRQLDPRVHASALLPGAPLLTNLLSMAHAASTHFRRCRQ